MSIKRIISEINNEFDWLEQGDNFVETTYLIYSDDDSMGMAEPEWVDDPNRQWMFNGPVERILEFTIRYPKGIDVRKMIEVAYEIYDDLINADMNVDSLSDYFTIEDGKNVVYIDDDNYSRVNLPEPLEENEGFDWIEDTTGFVRPSDLQKGDTIRVVAEDEYNMFHNAKGTVIDVGTHGAFGGYGATVDFYDTPNSEYGINRTFFADENVEFSFEIISRQ